MFNITQVTRQILRAAKKPLERTRVYAATVGSAQTLVAAASSFFVLQRLCVPHKRRAIEAIQWGTALAIALVLMGENWPESAAIVHLIGPSAAVLLTLPPLLVHHGRAEGRVAWLRLLGLSCGILAFFAPSFLIISITAFTSYQGKAEARGRVLKPHKTHHAMARTASLASLVVVGIDAALPYFGNTDLLLLERFLLLVMFAHYFHSGIGKVLLPFAYIRHNNPLFLALAARQMGWRGSASFVLAARHIPQSFVNTFVVGIELAAAAIPFIFWSHPEIALILLAGLIALHVAIFWATGDLFYSWITIHGIVGLVAWHILSSVGISRYASALQFHEVALLFLLLITAHYWGGAKRLAWRDSPYLVEYRLEVILFPRGSHQPVRQKVPAGAFGHLADHVTQGLSGHFDRVLCGLSSLRRTGSLGAGNSAEQIYCSPEDFLTDRVEELSALVSAYTSEWCSRGRFRRRLTPRQFYFCGVPSRDFPSWPTDADIVIAMRRISWLLCTSEDPRLQHEVEVFRFRLDCS